MKLLSVPAFSPYPFFRAFHKVLLILLLTTTCTRVFCQWDGNPKTVNNDILSISGQPMAVSDDAGGAIVLMSSFGTLVAQRQSASGELRWNNLASPVSIFQGTNINLETVQKDGNGGAYLLFTNAVDASHVDLYLQRLDSNGNRLFGNTGVKINPATIPVNHQGKLSVGKNGVTVVWSNSLYPETLNDSIINSAKLYIHRFSTSGTPLWAQLKTVSSAPAGRVSPVVVPDGKEGTYVIFTDFRNLEKVTESWGDYYTNLDVYMQYFDALGQQLWGSGDRALNAQTGEQLTYRDAFSGQTAIPDSAGGLEMIYLSDERVCAQKINALGETSWPLNFKIDADSRTKNGILATSDGFGGLVASWLTVPPTDPFIFTQRVTKQGLLPWGSTPLVVSAPGDGQFGIPEPAAVVTDREGNYVFAWSNTGIDTSDVNDPAISVTQLKAQKISPAGEKKWKSGLVIYQGPNTDASVSFPQLVNSTGNRLLATWANRSGDDPDGRVTSAMIEPAGTLVDELVRPTETTKDGNWSDPTIWADGKLPSPGADIVVKTTVTVTQHITVKSLKIIPPATVTVSAGGSVTITQ